MSRIRFLSVILIVIAIVAIWWVSQQPAGKPGRTAAPAIASFSGEPELVVEEIRHTDTPAGEVTQYGATLQNGDRVLFDVAGDAVVGFFRRDQSSRTIVVSETTAQQAAIGFAVEHGVDPALVEAPPTHAGLANSAGTHQSYRFVWTARDPVSGARLPHTAQVTVNAETGQVDSFNYVKIPVTVRTVPSVPAAAAEALTVEALQPFLPGARVVGQELVVGSVPLFAPQGTQSLLWQLELRGIRTREGFTPAATAFVDATTGTLLHVEAKR